MKLRWMGTGLLVCSVVGLPQAPPALATFPGSGGKIAFDDYVGSEHIFTIDPDGTNLTDLTPTADYAFDPDWSPDGTRIVFVSDNPTGISVMNADGSGKRLLLAGTETGPAFSPDGRAIAFSRTWPHPGLGVMNLRTGKLRQLTDDGSLDGGVDWSPDGSQVAFARGSGIWVVDANGMGETQLTTSLWDSTPSWSPDGSKIAFTHGHGQRHWADVWVMNADGSGQINVTGALTDGTQFSDPVWSPDESEIALNRYPDQLGSCLIIFAADGSAETGVYCGYDVRNISWQLA
jgi:Tol biopolymer transport system component